MRIALWCFQVPVELIFPSNSQLTGMRIESFFAIIYFCNLDFCLNVLSAKECCLLLNMFDQNLEVSQIRSHV